MIWDFFAISIEDRTFTTRVELCIRHRVLVRWWGQYVVCTNYSVSICRGTETDTLSQDDVMIYRSPCSPRYHPDSPLWPAVGVSRCIRVPGSLVIRSHHQIMPGPLSPPSRPGEPLLLIKTKPSLSLYEFIWSPPDSVSAYCAALASPRLTTETWHGTLCRLSNILPTLIAHRIQT